MTLADQQQDPNSPLYSAKTFEELNLCVYHLCQSCSFLLIDAAVLLARWCCCSDFPWLCCMFACWMDVRSMGIIVVGRKCSTDGLIAGRIQASGPVERYLCDEFHSTFEDPGARIAIVAQITVRPIVLPFYFPTSYSSSAPSLISHRISIVHLPKDHKT